MRGRFLRRRRAHRRRSYEACKARENRRPRRDEGDGEGEPLFYEQLNGRKERRRREGDGGGVRLMARPGTRRGGAVAILLLALLVIAVSLLFVQHHQAPGEADVARKHVVDGETITDMLLALPSLLPEARLESPVAVAIVRDPASVGYYDSPATLDSTLAVWDSTLRTIGARPRIVAPRKLGAVREGEVLLIAASPCLGLETQEAIDRTARTGGGVILTSISAMRDQHCHDVGLARLAELTGALRIDTLEWRDEVYVTLPVGGTLATDIPPGARLEVAPAVQIAVRHPRRDAYYSSLILNPEPVRREPLLDGAVVHNVRGRSRIVYWGFELRHLVDRPWDAGVATLLARNSVAWAAGRPLAAIAPWPEGYEAAAVIAQDVEDEFENARFAVDSLEAAGVTATYFLVSNQAERNRGLVDRMAKHGEIGTHTTDHRALRGHPLDVQLQRLRAAQRALHELTGRTVAGLRPPEELFDRMTLSSWVAAGGTYLFGSNSARVAAPELIPVDGDTLVLLSRVINDDFISVRKAGKTDVPTLTGEYLNSLEKVKALGGLYMLSYHSQLLARPELVPALAQIARALRADSTVWVTTAGDVARWWLGRARLDVRVESRGAELLASIANRGDRTVEGALLQITLPAGRTVRAVTGGELHDVGGEIASIALPALDPLTTETVRIALMGRDQ